MAAGEEHQHQLCVFLVVFEWFKDIDDDVEDVEGGPGKEEDDADSNQHPVGFLPTFHLPCSSVGGEILVCL